MLTGIVTGIKHQTKQNMKHFITLTLVRLTCLHDEIATGVKHLEGILIEKNKHNCVNGIIFKTTCNWDTY